MSNIRIRRIKLPSINPNREKDKDKDKNDEIGKDEGKSKD